MTDEPQMYINALADGGPIHGGSINFAAPPPGAGVMRGAGFLINVDDTQHEYTLRFLDGPPFQKWEYRGVTVEMPADIVDR
ncbi:hypothetical protein EUA93_18850 [Nocardioides oleivorans]|uniref:Uncharacterized protein n=1 Tax=Nocardioides oleivorans TaxID=273676 RepID=A0A4Q2RT46_9ACTN|nr:hypothetical protein [Nocardioides oleivorans]RYB90995.1 hypothetical protein EUA93_18850 [Nocardioides oleivorans]